MTSSEPPRLERRASCRRGCRLGRKAPTTPSERLGIARRRRIDPEYSSTRPSRPSSRPSSSKLRSFFASRRLAASARSASRGRASHPTRRRARRSELGFVSARASCDAPAPRASPRRPRVGLPTPRVLSNWREYPIVRRLSAPRTVRGFPGGMASTAPRGRSPVASVVPDDDFSRVLETAQRLRHRLSLVATLPAVRRLRNFLNPNSRIPESTSPMVLLGCNTTAARNPPPETRATRATRTTRATRATRATRMTRATRATRTTRTTRMRKTDPAWMADPAWRPFAPPSAVVSAWATRAEAPSRNPRPRSHRAEEFFRRRTKASVASRTISDRARGSRTAETSSRSRGRRTPRTRGGDAPCAADRCCSPTHCLRISSAARGVGDRSRWKMEKQTERQTEKRNTRKTPRASTPRPIRSRVVASPSPTPPRTRRC